jgi:hypothetical protein
MNKPDCLSLRQPIWVEEGIEQPCCKEETVEDQNDLNLNF